MIIINHNHNFNKQPETCAKYNTCSEAEAVPFVVLIEMRYWSAAHTAGGISNTNSLGTLQKAL